LFTHSLSTHSYTCEAWAITSQQLNCLEVSHNRCLRRMKGVSLLDHLTNEQLLLLLQSVLARIQACIRLPEKRYDLSSCTPSSLLAPAGRG
jgi:hypothetical protein